MHSGCVQNVKSPCGYRGGYIRNARSIQLFRLCVDSGQILSDSAEGSVRGGFGGLVSNPCFKTRGIDDVSSVLTMPNGFDLVGAIDLECEFSAVYS